MLQNYNKWKVLQQFIISPSSELQLREISRNIKLGLPSVKNYLQELRKEGLVVMRKSRVQSYPIYLANRDDNKFVFYKKVDLLDRISNSGLLPELYDKFIPYVIILFGSASRGEDVEGSDIDIFIGAKEGRIELLNYEKKMNRKINLFFASDFSRLSPELKNNLLNGIILKGYLQVF